MAHTPHRPVRENFSLADERDWRRLSWNWALAYDTKNWQLLNDICNPTVRVFYQALDSRRPNQTMSKEDYVARYSSKASLGDEGLETQHLLGAVAFDQVEPDLVVGNWQIQATHRRPLPDGGSGWWTGHSYVKHYYQKVDGTWTFAGVEPHTIVLHNGKRENVFGALV